ncbi:MAG: hypothetical protein V2A66_10800 [Pseudomonadota bacterium]
MKIADIQWGDDSAEKDPNLLEYFVSSDAFRRIYEKSKCIVIGRKGSGKSALRKKLEQNFQDQANTFVINISPKYNSIKSVLNEKDIVDTFGEEIFFQHVWLRQILLDSLCVVGDKAKGQFAQDSIEFARHIAVELNRTSKDLVENVADILAKVKGKVGSLGEFGINVERELRSIAEVESLEHHMQKIANDGGKFVVLIDDLDLGWDNSLTANNMLLGLLAATNYLSGRSPNIFTCVFMREDVYSILITKTQHADKYRNIERVRWNKEDLLNILHQRINYNRVCHNLLAEKSPFSTVFPVTIGTSNADNWLVERTLGRPRELIQLARYYTESVEGALPSADALKASEGPYSSWKLDDLCAEYSNQYPGLVAIFNYWKTKFFRHKYHLSKMEVEDMLLQLAAGVELNAQWWNQIVESTDIRAFMRVLYEIGFLGDFVKGGEGGSKIYYSNEERHEPRFEEVQIHPCFRKAVNTVERIKAKKSDVLPID